MDRPVQGLEQRSVRVPRGGVLLGYRYSPTLTLTHALPERARGLEGSPHGPISVERLLAELLPQAEGRLACLLFRRTLADCAFRVWGVVHLCSGGADGRAAGDYRYHPEAARAAD